jgi:hypothetical protein
MRRRAMRLESAVPGGGLGWVVEVGRVAEWVGVVGVVGFVKVCETRGVLVR